MSKPASKTLIGLFVVGALVLLVTVIAIFGSGKFFTKRPKFVMYFPGSVNGLTVGSPVQFRGVRIGEVTSISASFNPKDLSIMIPVYIETEPDNLHIPPEYKHLVGNRQYEFIHRLVNEGLKAELRMKSFITGQLYVAVDFYPGKPTRLTGLDKNYPEIPTLPSVSEVLLATLEQVPFADITNKLVKLTAGIERIVNSPEIKGSMTSMDTGLKDLGELIRNVDASVKPLFASLIETSTSANNAFSQAKKTLAFNEGVPGKFAENLQNTLKTADSTLEGMRAAIASYEKIADKNVNIGYDVSKTLREIDEAARSIRSLTDYLERHPEALLQGKQPGKGE